MTQLGETSEWCVGSIYCSIFRRVRNIASVLWCYSVKSRYRRPFHAEIAVFMVVRVIKLVAMEIDIACYALFSF